MNLIFLHEKTHKVHEEWAKSVGAKFVHINQLKDPKFVESLGKVDGILIEGGLPLWDAYKLKLKKPEAKLIYLNVDATFLVWRKKMLSGQGFLYFLKRLYAIRKVDGIISISNLVRLNLGIPEIIVRPFIEYKYNKPQYDPTNTNIITVGYYKEAQGIDILVKAFKIFKKRTNRKDVKLYLVGKGYPSKFASNDIILTGFVPNLEDVYKIAGLYIHAGRHQAFCIAPIEAMHYGIPAIVTNMTGCYEVLDPEFVTTVDPQDLARKIEWFFSLDENDKRKISRKCYKRTLRFTREKGIKKFKRAFWKLLELIQS